MTREEALDIIRFVFLCVDNHLNDDRQISAENIHEALIMACAALCKNSLPSSLDEAAERIVVSLVPTFGQKYEDGSYVQGTRDYFSRDELIGLVKAGAKWMAEQGESYETVISADKTVPVLLMKDVSEMEFDYGDKVVVQIRKK